MPHGKLEIKKGMIPPRMREPTGAPSQRGKIINIVLKVTASLEGVLARGIRVPVSLGTAAVTASTSWEGVTFYLSINLNTYQLH